MVSRGIPVSVANWMPRTVLTASSRALDRKSTRLNSSHPSISYAVFCLKKKTHNRLSLRLMAYHYHLDTIFLLLTFDRTEAIYSTLTLLVNAAHQLYPHNPHATFPYDAC